MPGLSIVFEGVDASGKTTQALKLSEYFRDLGKNVFYLKSPKGSERAESIFSDFLAADNPSIDEELFSFLLRDLVFYREIVLPKMDQDTILVFDRWEGSFLNYFHNVRKFPSDFLEKIWSFAVDDFKPDLFLLLDISLEETVSRIKQKDALSRFDMIPAEILGVQIRGFKDLAKKFDWKIIDGNKSILEVHRDICSAIQKRR